MLSFLLRCAIHSFKCAHYIAYAAKPYQRLNRCPAYHQGVGSRVPVSTIIPSLLGRMPGTREYSNLGAGLVASVLEAALNQSFENIMRIHLFDVLGVEASFIHNEYLVRWQMPTA